jgi:restriction system protein
MPIPSFQEIMLPLLKLASQQSELRINEAIERLASLFNITAEERRQLLPSGTQRIFNNRVGWAKTYLKEAGLIVSPQRGLISITDDGRYTLSLNPRHIDKAYLLRFQTFIEFLNRKSLLLENGDSQQIEFDTDVLPGSTPEELIANAYLNHKETVKALLLERLLQGSFSFFEQVVVDLMLKLGYGGSRQDAGTAIGKTGDEGIDGLINQDRLGLETIYLQAKRWQFNHTVGRPDIQKFAGALVGKSRKGVFITTSSFSREARTYAENLSELRIILIDGEQLCELMWESELGVETFDVLKLKRINGDYFDESS